MATNSEDGARSYIERVRQDGQRYTHELLQKNEALSALVASLEAEKRRLVAQIEAIREEAERYNREHADLQARLAEIQQQSQRFAAQFVEVERQNSNLASLYVASYQIHGTLDRAQVLQVIQEILANLVGSEETAVFELEQGGRELALIAHNGAAAEPLGRVALGCGVIGRAAQTGDIWIAADHPRASGSEAQLTACVPLKLDGRVTGLIAIFKLLPQKSGLEPGDRELFELLATHAAMALYCTSLHRRLMLGAGT